MTFSLFKSNIVAFINLSFCSFDKDGISAWWLLCKASMLDDSYTMACLLAGDLLCYRSVCVESWKLGTGFAYMTREAMKKIEGAEDPNCFPIQRLPCQTFLPSKLIFPDIYAIAYNFHCNYSSYRRQAIIQNLDLPRKGYT